MNKQIWALCLVIISLCGASFAAQLTQINLTQKANKATLNCSVQGAFTHKVFTLKSPDRVVVDLIGVRMATPVNHLGAANQLVRGVRTGMPDARTLRLVFDVGQKVSVSSSPWAKGVSIHLLGSGPIIQSKAAKPTLVRAPVHINKPQAAASVRQQSKAVAVASKPKTPAQSHAHPQQTLMTHHTPIHIPHRPAQSLRDVIVVLDAGHGGKDPGARGPRRSQEKNVVLAITLKLKQLIDRQPGMHAVLTRSGDYYVGLRQRLDIARKYNGDIFVSIHADAFNNPHSNGASVFALSQSGATSEAARWIAEKENYSELGGVNLGGLDDTNGVVRSVLIDLSQTATINSSLQMGTRVLSQLSAFTRLHNSKVEQARFMVLKSPDMPSILVETGFISNPAEERNLTSAAYQSRLSQAVFQGIKGYFWSNPPHGSRIEAMTGSTLQVAKAAKTIPAIASRPHVSARAMQASNRLPNHSVLQSGQKIVTHSAWG